MTDEEWDASRFKCRLERRILGSAAVYLCDNRIALNAALAAEVR
jgi:hypothetical protein